MDRSVQRMKGFRWNQKQGWRIIVIIEIRGDATPSRYDINQDIVFHSDGIQHEGNYKK